MYCYYCNNIIDNGEWMRIDVVAYQADGTVIRRDKEVAHAACVMFEEEYDTKIKEMTT